MLHPSYTDLMKVVNSEVEEGEEKVVNSRYSIVLATSKRARQLIDDAEPKIATRAGEKPLSIAIDELNNSKIHILSGDEEPEIDEVLDVVEEADADEELLNVSEDDEEDMDSLED